MAERLGNRASNPKVAGSSPGHAMTLCPWARHFNIHASGNVPVLTVRHLLNDNNKKFNKNTRTCAHTPVGI